VRSSMDHSLCSKMTRRDFVLSLQDQHCHSACRLLQATPGNEAAAEAQQETR
jgi:hypothetical protein